MLESNHCCLSGSDHDDELCLHPQMVQAATGTENGIFIESKNNEAPVFEAGKKKNWNFVITNNSGNVLNNVTITPDLGDKNEDWPFKTEKQSYQKSLGTT